MTGEQFDEVAAELQKRADEILAQRGAAYANAGDRLANFKEIGARAGITQLQVVHIFLQKGLAVLDKFAQGKTVEGEAVIERFADALNYVKLMYAVYVEEQWRERK